MTHTERRKLLKSFLGSTVNIKIDRPVGTVHKGMLYTLNYGYIDGIPAPDGEDLDAYLLGVTEPLKEYRGADVIGAIHRLDDCEDKLVLAPKGSSFYQNDIAELTEFQEKHFKTEIISYREKSCGAIPYTLKNGEPHFLLLKNPKNGECGFPKGHMEPHESELETAVRETYEETSVKAVPDPNFRRKISYPLGNRKSKTVVYFLARFEGLPSHNKGFETNDYLMLPFDKAHSALTFDSTKKLIAEANEFLKGIF